MMRLRSVLLLTAFFLFGVAAGLLWLGERPAAPERPVAARDARPAASAPPVEMSPDLDAEERRNIEVFRRASDSVVHITAIALRRDFFSRDVFQIPQGTGSGFVWDEAGHIVTNFHVIEGGSAFLVTLADQSEFEAEVVGYAASKDLAVLRIDAPSDVLHPLPVGESRNLAVGQRVLAVGNPFGLDHSLTVGVVSALGRELQAPDGRTIRDVIQTDAAINPGNSGGPLLDSGGRLIGVSSAIYSPSGASAGIGFAVPVDTVRQLVPQLIEHGKPVQPGIGVSLVRDDVAREYRLEGVVVEQVVRGGPAERAGIEGLGRDRRGRRVVGDQIIAVDGNPIEDRDDLIHEFERAGVGATVELTLLRAGETRTVKVTLAPLD